MAIDWQTYETEYLEKHHTSLTSEQLRMGLFRLNKDNNLEVNRSRAAITQKMLNLGLSLKPKKSKPSIERSKQPW